MTWLINESPTLHERLAVEQKRIQAAMALLAPGPKRDALLQKLRQLGVAAETNEWLSSPGLRAPL
ncbi:hypothetical protein ACTGJ9_034870 [Bradyrhizobium sp. RDM12]